MIVFPHCKINIGLNIVSKRTDGYHNLQSVFYPIALTDALEIIAAPANSPEPINYTHSGLPILDTSPQNNLCIKAYQLIKKDYSQLPPVSMHLHKIIPMGAGLGGGSADAAFTLRLLNQKFELGLSNQQLLQYALYLGSDCPFFMENTPCLVQGRGEQLQPVNLGLSDYKILVVYPGIHINTGMAFKQIKPGTPTTDLSELIHQPVEIWKHCIFNDFETVLFNQYPSLAKLKRSLYEQGALYASMSGSGSTLYGIFKEEKTIPLPADYFVKWV